MMNSPYTFLISQPAVMVPLLVIENELKQQLDTKIACNLKICPNIEPFSFEQVQGHWKKNGVSITFL